MSTTFNTGDEVARKYQVLRTIGSGGMGAVVEVRDQGGESYALKYCVDASPKARRRFKREVRIMAGIRHSHVVPILDHDLDHDPPYFVMPLAVGTLQDELEELAADEEAALDAFEQMCLGIQAIHNSAAVHRDIKPLNALRLYDRTIVVSDLGLAKFHERDTTTLTQADAFLGTRIYCAPEQLLPEGSRDADERTDIFQLGKSLYHLLTGRHPALIDPNLVDAALAHIIQKATKDNPADRYENIGRLLDAIHIYRLSKDPTTNPKEALESLIQQARDDLARNEYNGDTVRQILQLFARRGILSNDTLIEFFDEIPRELLPVVSREFADELELALCVYSDAIEAAVGAYNFSYAETVAGKMRLIFENTESPNVRVLALRAVLVAAVQLHRFAAMNTFNVLMQQVTSGEAMAVADMLHEGGKYYRVVADQIPSDRLHPAIRMVKEALEQADSTSGG